MAPMVIGRLNGHHLSDRRPAFACGHGGANISAGVLLHGTFHPADSGNDLLLGNRACLFRRVGDVNAAKIHAFDVIGKLAEAARDEKQVPQERLKAAGFIYREWGIVPVFRGANDQLAVYIPTSEDQQSRQKHLDLRQKAEKSLAVVHWQLKQLPRIALSFLCLSASVFFLGLAVYVFRKPRSAAIVDEGK